MSSTTTANETTTSTPTPAASPRLLPGGWLRQLGVYGYDNCEDIILAALITADPLLLIGKAGTGKTFLLNSLSEALQLTHRHYNASLISFDDLAGFPYPDSQGTTIRYIETPATIWQAQSVLVDEISRCRPEHQNRFFSLIHERRLQGLALPNLTYRWAAMNPCSEEPTDEIYEGTHALDQALADRFSFVITVPDWDGLSSDDRLLVADARGIDAPSLDSVGLAAAVAIGQERFRNAPADLHEFAAQYASAAATLFLTPKIRLSPRRVRMLSRNLIAVTVIHGGQPEPDAFLHALRTSLPQPAWGKYPDDAVIRSVHARSWDLASSSTSTFWITTLLEERDISRRCRQIILDAPSPDAATVAIAQSLTQLPPSFAAVFALAMTPAIHTKKQFCTEEGRALIAAHAAPILEVQGEATWNLAQHLHPATNPHPTLSACATILSTLGPKRKARARQLFYHCIVSRIEIPDPASLEATLDKAITTVRSSLRSAQP
jgi:MoxR-like ATPase